MVLYDGATGSPGNPPILMDRKRLRVDAYGVANFKSRTTSGGPCQSGCYKIICNYEMTEVHVRGIFMDGSVTSATFNGVMYAVALSLLPLLRCSGGYRLLTVIISTL